MGRCSQGPYSAVAIFMQSCYNTDMSSEQPGGSDDLEKIVPAFDASTFRVTNNQQHKGGLYKADAKGMQRDYNNGSQGAWAQQAAMKKKEMLAFLLQGYSLKEASKAIGVSYTTGRVYMRDPEIMAELQTLSESIYRQVYGETLDRKLEAHVRILEMADEALSVLENLLQSPNDNVRLKAAESVLDRHGEVPKQTKTTGVQTNVTITGAEIMTAIKAAQDLEGRKSIAPPRLIPAEMFEKDKQ